MALARSTSAKTSVSCGISTAEKYRNRDGNQQTLVDFDGRITSLRREFSNVSA
jgi:hypothetical protein